MIYWVVDLLNCKTAVDVPLIVIAFTALRFEVLCHLRPACQRLSWASGVRAPGSVGVSRTWRPLKAQEGSNYCSDICLLFKVNFCFPTTVYELSFRDEFSLFPGVLGKAKINGVFHNCDILWYTEINKNTFEIILPIFFILHQLRPSLPRPKNA